MNVQIIEIMVWFWIYYQIKIHTKGIFEILIIVQPIAPAFYIEVYGQTMFYKDIVKCNLNFIKMSWCLYAWSLSFLKYKIKWIIWYFFSFHQGEITLQKSLGTQWPASKKWALVLVIFILLSSLSCSKYLITFLMIQNWSTALHYTLNIFVQKKIVLIFRQWLTFLIGI